MGSSNSHSWSLGFIKLMFELKWLNSSMKSLNVFYFQGLRGTVGSIYAYHGWFKIAFQLKYYYSVRDWINSLEIVAGSKRKKKANKNLFGERSRWWTRCSRTASISINCDFAFSASSSRRPRGPSVLAFKTIVCFLQLTNWDCDVVGPDTSPSVDSRLIRFRALDLKNLQTTKGMS